MGIPSFQKFIEDEIPNGLVKINMIDAVKEWKIAHPDQQPTIIIRLKELLLSVVQLNVKAACFGGSHQYYYDRLDAFLQPLMALGMKFVFFGGCVKGADRYTKLMTRGDRGYKKYLQIMQSIDRTKEIKTGAANDVRMLLGLYEEGLAKKYGEYRYADGDLNRAIVSYIHTNGDSVVAVLAKDSDFLVYDLCDASYWGCGIDYLNFNEMTTYTLDRPALLTHLELTPYQFHVMAAILAVLQEHARLHYARVKLDVASTKRAMTPNHQKIFDLCECVKQRVVAAAVQSDFAALAGDMFKSHVDEYIDLVEAQFNKYNSNVFDGAMVEHGANGDVKANGVGADQDVAAKLVSHLDANANETEIEDKSPPAIDAALIQRALLKNRNIYAILADEVIMVDVNFIDLGRWNHSNAMAYTSLFVIVFKRAMGMVLNSMRGQSHDQVRRRFLMKPRECEKFKVFNKTLLYPDFEVPCVRDLIDGNKDIDQGNFELKKWTALLWILELKLENDAVKRICDVPPELMPAVMTVLFLLWHNQITPMEGDTIILSERDMVNGVLQEKDVRYPINVDGRIIRVAHLYIHARVLVSRCFQICSINNSFSIPVSFDGIHFHNLLDTFIADNECYQTARSGFKDFLVDAF